MRRTTLLIIALFFTFSAALAEESAGKKFLEWHLRDLYYYDNKDTMVQLEVVPKLFVRFTKELTAEERVSFFAEFSPISQKPEQDDPLSFILAFDNSTKPFALLEMANKMTRSGLAVASPVFLLENVEAVIEGIAVEPKIVLTSERLYERMKKYGDFSSRKTAYENGAWVFLVDEVKPPLNLLVFTNLIKNDSWVRRAYPHFRFLHDPITAFITVEPVSGTVGEVRTVTFTIEIFDPVILLSENELPEFGNGLFMPIQGTLTAPSAIKYPPGYLFELVGEPVKAPVRQDNRSRIYKISRKFKFYALGEWTINPQPVSYTKNGFTKEIKSLGFTLIVNSQIGNLKITDMPFPRSLIYSVKSQEIIAEVALPGIPSYWFDAWTPKDAYKTIQYSRLVSVSLGILGITILLAFAISKLNKAYKRMVSRRLLIGEIEKVIDSARDRKSYADYSEAFSRILVGLVPYFSSHPNWEEVKDDERVLRFFETEEREILRRIFIELLRRHKKDFVPEAGDLMRLDGDIRAIFEIARQHFTALEEA